MSVLELPLMNKNTSVQDAFNDFVTTDYSAVVIKTSKVLSVLLVCVLAACNSSAPPPAPPAAATISNLTVFLVQGTPEQKSIDQVTYRKHDYPLPNGYQVDDSVLLPDGRILQTFAYPPFGPANFAKGDGGQIVSINGATVLFTETTDQPVGSVIAAAGAARQRQRARCRDALGPRSRALFCLRLCAASMHRARLGLHCAPRGGVAGEPL